MASSKKAEGGAGNEITPSIENCAEIEGALPARDPNLSNLDKLKAVEVSLNDFSIAGPGATATTHKNKNNNTVEEEENALPTNNNDEQEQQQETNNDSGDDEDEDENEDEQAPSTPSTTNSTASSASTNISTSTQVRMALLARHVRRTLNEIVAAENSIATLPGPAREAREAKETAANLARTTTRILGLYVSVCNLFEEDGLESVGGCEMAATIRATIAEYPTIRGRCGF
ncbi:hypothetical protein GX51_01475 [Blastomyces parvus]|uniref:Uncharacterized protein n=1 Tax=Blastomyces parvus TaxID=2060905 RepID=A0A2B7X8N7_9EURO|nr:hypothetical protein GX51_01475 [Blastomyces parvus]